MPYPMKVSWLDAAGLPATCTLNVFEDPGDTLADLLTKADTLAEKADALSDAAVTGASMSVVLEDLTLSGVDGTQPYHTSEDKATLYFKCADGTRTSVSIPGPKASVFGADKETVNSVETAVAAFITDMLAIGANKLGIAIVSYLFGKRNRAVNRN